MIEYHKIQSIYLRDPATNHKTFLTGQYSTEAIGYLANNEWVWTEKIDGTNVRVYWNGSDLRFGGRTADAQMPVFLLDRLQALFTPSKMRVCFPDIPVQVDSVGGPWVMLFGEGFGAKIQKGGGRYVPDGVNFILFDVMVNGNYLTRENVEDIAAKLDLLCVPIIGRGTLEQAVAFTRAGYKSRIALDGDYDAEGIVLRPACELTDRRGHRVITKIKARDFERVAVAA